MSTNTDFPRREDIDLLIFDFDGVMTDNRVLVFPDGREAVFCNRGDGLGIDMLRDAGLPMLILSTEKNEVVAARAGKLRIDVRHGVSDKARVLNEIVSTERLDPSRIAFVGNDVNDLGVLNAVGWPICPKDAHPSVAAVSRWVVPVNGGYGVIRYLADELLR